MTGLVRARYTLEFKEAVRLVRGGQTVSSGAKTLGLSDQTLHNWLKVEAAGGFSFVRRGPKLMTSPSSSSPQIFVQTLVRRANEFFQRVAGKVAVLVVDRLDARAIHCQQLAAEQIETPAQQHELSENLFERGAIVAPEIGDGLEVRLQGPQQPDD